MSNIVIPLCNFEGAQWLIFGPNVAPLVYYSHLPIIIISIILAFFVLFQKNNCLPNKILFFTLTSFATWVFLDSIFWASNRGDVIMFVWSTILLIEPLVFIGSFYLLYTLVEKKDLPFKHKLFFTFVYLPLIILVPTKYSLPGFDIPTCLSVEGPIALYYTYLVETLAIICILKYSIGTIIKNKERRVEILFLSLGIILFLFSFAWGNIVGSFTDNWQLGQYGLFGMPIFAGFLVYSIVRFKTFNIKLVGAQALVVTLWIALASLLFIRTIENVRIVVSVTLILFLIIGLFLVRSVKREIEQREKIEILAKDLENANGKLKELDQMKSEFLSLASHQMRAPLTAMKGYASMLIEGEFGTLPPKAGEAIDVIMRSTQNLINTVNDFLNISRIEQGRMVYEKTDFNLPDLLKEVIEERKINIEKAGLSLKVELPNEVRPFINADKDKVRQIIGNILDNSVKYTVSGGITISLLSESLKAMIRIKDTGIGIDPSEIGKLFNKFARSKSANKTNVIGTGLGLYIAKKMAQDQGGDIKVFSEGEGKGSTFTIELPKAKV